MRSMSERRIVGGLGPVLLGRQDSDQPRELRPVMLSHAGMQQHRLFLHAREQGLQLSAPSGDAGEILPHLRRRRPVLSA